MKVGSIKFFDLWSHPSLAGKSTKILTRELVYYILLGTPRSVQKCLWSNLTADFLGDNHLFLFCDQMTHQTLQLIGYLDSWWNSDLFEKKISKSDMFWLLQITKIWKWEPLLDSFNSANSGRIWTNFFFKQVRILPGVQISHQLQNLVCHLVTNQKKVIISQKISCQIWPKACLDAPRGP